MCKVIAALVHLPSCKHDLMSSCAQLSMLVTCVECALVCMRVLTAVAHVTKLLTCSLSRLDETIPYVEDLAYPDWAPYSYLDGFHGDPSTAGTTNQRANLITESGSKVLEVLLPEGCVTSKCAMQVKSKLLLPVDSATLKFKCVSLPATRAAHCNRCRNACLHESMHRLSPGLTTPLQTRCQQHVPVCTALGTYIYHDI